jgi:tellurite resistance protein TerC
MPLAHAGNAALLAVFALTVLSMLALDLGVFQRTPRAPTVKEAALWSAVWVALALAFGAGIAAVQGAQKGAEFLTSYLVEKALSLDNLFVMMLVFQYFRVPARAERKVLGYGIVGAAVLRGIFIVAGAALVARFHALTYVLGGFLAIAGVKLFRSSHAAPAFTGGKLERALRRLVPVTDDVESGRFFTRVRGLLHATPLLLALVAVEAADIVFALDSIPAVFAVTTDPFIAFTSNLFAVLGLRALYALLAVLLARLRHLKTGLALVLLFVGAKMLFGWAVEMPAFVTLVVVVLVIGGAVVASLVTEKKERMSHVE